MKALVLAGGSGTRLWPLSRKNYPKQFLKLNSTHSLLRETIERLMQVFAPEDIIVITNKEYKFHVISDLNSIAVDRQLPPFSNMILEPCRAYTGVGSYSVKFVMSAITWVWAEGAYVAGLSVTPLHGTLLDYLPGQ